MKRFLFYIFVSIFVFDQAWSKTTYKEIVEHFHRKAKAEAAYVEIDWNKKLMPLFQTIQMTEEVADVFEPWKGSTNITLKLSFEILKLPHTPYTNALDSVKNDIFKTEEKINKLSKEIVDGMSADKGELSDISTSLMKNYRKWQKKPMNHEQILMIETHIDLRLFNRRAQLQQTSVKKMTDVVNAKRWLTIEAQSFINKLNDIKKMANNIIELSTSLETYKRNQDEMYNSLKEAGDAIDENRWVRPLYVDFLFGFKTDLSFSRAEIAKSSKRKSRS
ncbi:uncharacterized protein LOC116347151 [Contarinia nasturtii]|uniref:uncharacterized protein LOC116347151 n=1 Tax=Contarinia nasturtii TaxID=265458 RepID=UPI0012D3AF4A|nr:uncharacterized protein LOC116347151 [Contarinia nasturtii]